MSPRPVQVCLSLFAAALGWALPGSAAGMILYGRNNTENLTPPANGAPWAHAARLGTGGSEGNASGVYLGNRFVITADHVASFNNGNQTLWGNITINNQTYSRNDTAFSSNGSLRWIRLVSGNATADASVFIINGDPSLTPIPIVMNGTDDDTGVACTLIGSGAQKGDLTATNRWAWQFIFTQRWGLNTTNSTVRFEAGVPLLSSTASSLAGDDEASLAIADSGAGLFIQFGDTWKLAGTGYNVDLVAANNSTFGTGAAPSPRDISLYIRLADFAHLLRFDHWRNRFLGNATAPYTLDTDGDGLNLLEEYIFDANPALPDPSRAPEIGSEMVGGVRHLTLTYWRRMTATDATVAVEECSDLTGDNWVPATTATEVIVTGSNLLSVWRIKTRVPFGTATRKFLRLKITQL